MMQDSVGSAQKDDSGRRVVDLTMRLLLIVGLIFWCFLLFRPFLLPVVWGMVLAVAFGPLFFRLESLLGGRRKVAGVVFILVGVGALVVPAVFLSESFFDGLRWLSADENQGEIRVPSPPEGVADWPVVGQRVHELWAGASGDLETTLRRFEPQIMSLGTWLLSTLTGFGLAFLLTILSVIIAGVMLINAEGGGQALRALGTRIAGERGENAVDLAAQAIRSVAYGVVGVAAVQAILSAIGLFLAGIPGAGFWAALILVLAVAQLPPLLVLLPAVIYFAATSDSTLGLVIFAVWSLIVSFSDAFLKPLLLGRGLDIPVLVILIGAIGGMIRGGVIGLFVGAVVMAIGYKLYLAWLKRDDFSLAETASG